MGTRGLRFGRSEKLRNFQRKDYEAMKTTEIKTMEVSTKERLTLNILMINQLVSLIRTLAYFQFGAHIF